MEGVLHKHNISTISPNKHLIKVLKICIAKNLTTSYNFFCHKVALDAS